MICSVITLQSGAGGVHSASSSAVDAASGGGAGGVEAAVAAADTIGAGGDNMMAQDVQQMRVEMIGKFSPVLSFCVLCGSRVDV